MKAKLITKLYVACPHCGDHEFGVSHLLEPSMVGREYGPWYCNECGKGSKFVAHSATDVEVFPVEDAMPHTLNLLMIPPGDHPVYLVVHGVRTADAEPGGPDTAFYYDEHTCPTNWVGYVEAFIEDGDDDPHGVAQFIRAVDRPTLAKDETEYDLRGIFPEAFGIEGGEVIDGQARGPRASIA